MAVSVSCSISDELNLFLSEAMEGLHMKRSDIIKEALYGYLKEKGYYRKKKGNLLNLDE